MKTPERGEGRTGTGEGDSSSSSVAAGDGATAAVAASVVASPWTPRRTQTSKLSFMAVAWSSAVEATIDSKPPSDSKRERGWPTALLLSEVAPAALVARKRTTRKAREREDGRFWSETAVATEARSISIDAMIRQLAHSLLWLARARAPTRAPPTAIERAAQGVGYISRTRTGENRRWATKHNLTTAVWAILSGHTTSTRPTSPLSEPMSGKCAPLWGHSVVEICGHSVTHKRSLHKRPHG